MIMCELSKTNRAIVLLASYDSVALYLTLQALNHTIAENEMVVIILNGKRGIRSSYVEQIARQWIKNKVNKYVVRPLNYGNDPYRSIQEVLNHFEPLKNIEYICKIDDDLIPLKKNWLNHLEQTYIQQAEVSQVGFVTSLINNNAWGFAELISIFDKVEEYQEIMNYPSIWGTSHVIDAGQIAIGVNGTIWQYPYLAQWCHEWTTLDLKNYVAKTQYLPAKEICQDTHYSIGCIFFKKHFWHDVESINKKVNFDELAIHLYCQQQQLKKIAVLNEPMVHLYYFVQRKANAHLIPKFAQSFTEYWGDASFLNYPKFEHETQLMMEFEEFTMNSVFQNFNPSSHHKKSFWRKLKNSIRKRLAIIFK